MAKPEFPRKKIKLKGIRKMSKKQLDPQLCTIYYQDNREMTVVNIVNQGKADPQMVKSHSTQQILSRNNVQKTPYFGQKRMKFDSGMGEGVKECESARLKNSDILKYNLKQQFDKYNNQWDQKHRRQSIMQESEDDVYNEDSFYDLHTESEDSHTRQHRIRPSPQ